MQLAVSFSASDELPLSTSQSNPVHVLLSVTFAAITSRYCLPKITPSVFCCQTQQVHVAACSPTEPKWHPVKPHCLTWRL